MQIKKDKILIRNATPRDAHILCSWWNDGTIMDHAGFPNGIDTTPEKIMSNIMMNTDERGRLCIIEFDSIPIGEINYRNLGDKTAEIGIKICDFSMHNKGIGTISLFIFVKSLFNDYGYNKIILDTNLVNKRAQHVYEKIGFIQTGIEFNSWRNQLGELQSKICYELKKKSFLGDRVN